MFDTLQIHVCLFKLGIGLPIVMDGCESIDHQKVSDVWVGALVEPHEAVAPPLKFFNMPLLNCGTIRVTNPNPINKYPPGVLASPATGFAFVLPLREFTNNSRSPAAACDIGAA
jgi:hypothetical protein